MSKIIRLMNFAARYLSKKLIVNIDYLYLFLAIIFTDIKHNLFGFLISSKLAINPNLYYHYYRVFINRRGEEDGGKS